ncbi:MAG: hypothetical protein JRJ84_15820 [Deltaproteobacteria bacterium]|nr:hypothetical protein [Deltaproteobacteria bacterium]
MITALLLSFALPADAGTGALTIRSENPVVIAVDGMLVPFSEDALIATAYGLGGQHQVSLHNNWGREIQSHVIEVPNDYEVRCTWARRTLDCYEAVPLDPPLGMGVIVAPGSPGAGAVTVGVGTYGTDVTVTESSTTTTTVGEPAFAEPEPVVFEPPPPLPDRVELIVRSTDGQWADVVVDGKVVMEFRNEDEKKVWITPGIHTVEIREFMQDQGYATGRLDTGYAARVTLGITEDTPVVCYDHDGWYAQ